MLRNFQIVTYIYLLANQVSYNIIQDKRIGYMELNFKNILQKELPPIIKKVVSTLKETKSISLQGFNDLEKKLALGGSQKELMIEIHTFAFALGRVPGIWARLFDEEKIHNTGKNIQLGNHIYIFNQYLDSELSKSQIHKQFYTLAKQEINQFILLCSQQLVQYYKECQTFLVQKTSSLKSQNTKSAHTNKYVMFKILRELSHECSIKVRNIILPLFQKVEPITIKKIVDWIIKKHQVVELSIQKKIEEWQTSKKQDTKEKFTDYLNKYLQRGKEVSHQRIIRSDGKPALLVTRHVASAFGHQNLVFKDEFNCFAVMSCSLVSSQWKTCNHSKTNLINPQSQKFGNDLEEIKNQIVQFLMQQEIQIHKNQSQMGIEDIEGMMGHFLANFKNYSSINKFIEDYKKRPVISNTFKYLTFPTSYKKKRSFFFDDFYQFKRIVVNNHGSTEHRLQDLQRFFIKAGISFVGVAVGSLLGQVLIPIQIIGQFLGGKSSFFFVQLFLKKSDQQVEEKHYKKIYNGIKKQMKPEGFWTYNDSLINTLQIKCCYFQKTVPKLRTLDDRSLWMTALCFFILSFLECKYQHQSNLKKKEKKEKKDSYKRMCSQVLSSNKQKFIEQGICSDVEKCLFYLQNRNFKIQDYSQQLIDMMTKILKL